MQEWAFNIVQLQARLLMWQFVNSITCYVLEMIEIHITIPYFVLIVD